MSTIQQSFYLKSGDQRLACTALIPEKVCVAVLMLLPFAEERKGSLPLLLRISRKLYQNNVASLIFDWRGSGDSSGKFENINPDDFKTDFNTALAWLKTNIGDVPIITLGIRLSATFLLQLKHPEIEKLVMISPTSGDEFMRQLLQRRMVNDMVAYGKAIESRTSLLESLKSGSSVDLDGYIFSASFYRWTEKISISNIQQEMSNDQGGSSGIRRQESGGRRERSDNENDEHSTSKETNTTSHIPLSTIRFPQTLLIPGGHSRKTTMEITDAMDNVETEEIRFPPFWNTVGHVDLKELIESVTQWIFSKTAQTLSNHAEQPDSECEVLFPTNIQLIDIVSGDATIRAAISSPNNTPKAGVLFLPGWSGDRTGPHRIFVQLARKLRSEGFLCMRPDFKGRGLSDGEHGNASIASMAEDADIALEELEKLLL